MTRAVKKKLKAIAENMPLVYEAGKAQGGNTEEAYNQGVEAGKQAQNEAFWEVFTTARNSAGKPYVRNNYQWAFMLWREENFYPTKDITPKTLYGTFQSFNEYGTPIDLRQRLIDCGVKLETQDVESAQAAFSMAYISVLPALDLRKCTIFNGTFNDSKIGTIEKIILKDDGSQEMMSNTFKTATLKNITFEGKIGTKVSFAECSLLTAESVQSIIDALLPLEEEVTRTITFHSDISISTEQETEIAGKGWTLVQ